MSLKIGSAAPLCEGRRCIPQWSRSKGGHILRLTIVVINYHNYDNHDNNGTFDYNGKMLVLTMIQVVATSTMIREPDSLRATILALSMNLGSIQTKFQCET